MDKTDGPKSTDSLNERRYRNMQIPNIPPEKSGGRDKHFHRQSHDGLKTTYDSIFT